MIDAHTHLIPQHLPQLKELPPEMRLIANAQTPEEAGFLLSKRESRLFVSVGLHPWQADRFSVEEFQPYYARGAAVGEIGMDSVWCEVPLKRQEEVFCRQLELAEQLQKPVILHTKGCEKRILPRLSCFSGRKLIHWYSSTDYLEDYLALDCYFSVGPDLSDEAVRRVACSAPIHRLLLETDGIDAIAWATGKQIAFREVPAFLESQAARVAELRGISKEVLEAQMEENLCTFLGIPPLEGGCSE